jgi:hypothetical protein
MPTMPTVMPNDASMPASIAFSVDMPIGVTG